jgi:hypothetical protein
MHHSRILKRAFSVAHHRAAAERKDLPGYRDVSGEDYEAEIYRAANWQFHVAAQSPN